MTQSNRSAISVSNSLPVEDDLRRLKLLRLFLGITLVLSVLAAINQRQYADEIAVWAVSPSWRWAIGIGWAVIGIIGVILASTWISTRDFWLRSIEWGADFTTKLGSVRLLLVAVLSLVFPLLVLGQYGRFVLPFFTRLLIFWLLVCLGSWVALGSRLSKSPVYVTAAVALIFGIAHRIAVFSADLSLYPFSLGWSEASRYYYASLFFAKRIYGFSIPPSVLHPTRYLIQSVPFLIPGTGLAIHRLWQVMIWILTTAAAGVVLAIRLNIQSRWPRRLLVLWVFLFLFQGPVWYHLLVMVMFIAWGFRTDRPLLSLAVVILASLWAGMSRVNWIPVPGMLAALLYFLECEEDESSLQYFKWPAVWFLIGSAAGFASQWLYILISGNDVTRFGSSFDSPLLWYRLLPSETYPLGVLPGIILASMPLLLIAVYKLRNTWQRIRPNRLFGMIAILILLFGGGILVSVKIGGGSNLHNLDAFLVALMLIGVYAIFNNWRRTFGDTVEQHPIPILLLWIVIWTPICFAIGMGKPLREFDFEKAQQSLARIEHLVSSAEDGDLLFISQRHLITFGLIDDVKLIPEYETVFLMEMAMARNQEYLDTFQADLKNHRFDLIVVDQLSTQLQGRDHNFAEENNAWVEEVSMPILCHYQEFTSISDPPLQFFVPLDNEGRCNS